METKILITGGAGFIGSSLAERLAKLNMDITLLIRKGDSKDNLKNFIDKIKLIEGDVCDKELIEELIKDKDFIFHFAWQTELKKANDDPKKNLQENLDGIINILEGCRKYNNNAKIIFPSTVTVSDENNFYIEDGDINPKSIYDLHKLFAEYYLMMYYKVYGIKYTCLRLANVFGEKQRIDNPKRGILNYFIGQILKGEKIKLYGYGEFIRDYSYIENILDTFLLTILKKETDGHIFTIGSGEGYTMIEIAEIMKKIFNEFNIKVEYEKVPYPDGISEVEKRNFIADIIKFQKFTGWSPKINIEEGLKKTIDFFMKKNKLNSKDIVHEYYQKLE